MSTSKRTAVPSASQNCARIKKLGYKVGKHMDLYGEHIELVSDPFPEGGLVVIHAVSKANPTVRTIELPVSLLSGWEDLFKEPADPADPELPASTPPAGPAAKAAGTP